jgi:hypothetical protein
VRAAHLSGNAVHGAPGAAAARRRAARGAGGALGAQLLHRPAAFKIGLAIGPLDAEQEQAIQAFMAS